MIKKIIYNYIYNDELSEEEIEYYCDYDDDYNCWFVRRDSEWDLHQHRLEDLVDDLKENGVHNIIDLRVEDYDHS